MSLMHNAETIRKTLAKAEDISGNAKVKGMFQELMEETFGDKWEFLMVELASSDLRMFTVLKRSENDLDYMWKFFTDMDNFVDIDEDGAPGFKNALRSGENMVTVYINSDYYNVYPLDGFIVDTSDDYYTEEVE